MKIKPLCKNQGINDPGIIMFSLLSVIKMIKNIHATPPPLTSNQVYKVIVSLGILLSGFFLFLFLSHS